MGKIIAIANQKKGGVGKLPHLLIWLQQWAVIKKKTLLVDMDPQRKFFQWVGN